MKASAEQAQVRALQRVVEPVRDFAGREASGGVVLLVCAIVAMVAVNSPIAAAYLGLWHEPLAVALAGVGVSKSVHFWINDALMALFFFVVGLEIKREIWSANCRRWRLWRLPLVAAVGGMVLPAALFWAPSTPVALARGR